MKIEITLGHRDVVEDWGVFADAIRKAAEEQGSRVDQIIHHTMPSDRLNRREGS